MSAPASLASTSSKVPHTTRRRRSTGTSRTIRAMIATALMIVPLKGLFTNSGWLIDAWLAVAIVGAPAAIIRATRPVRVWQTWLGVALLVPWLTARFAGGHAIAGFIPGGHTWSDVSSMLDSVRHLSSDGVAPVHATESVSFVLALLGGLLAAFVDLIAVVGRRAAIGGVPILVVYTVVGAVTRHPVNWLLFVASGAAFLVLLSIDSYDTVREWGRVVPGEGGQRTSAGIGVSGPRIAIIAVAIAVVLPLVAPSRTSNLIADAVHGTGTGHGPGGFGAGSGTALDPFAALKGQLVRTKATPLFTVTVQPGSPTPFYLRTNVLQNYSDRGWSPGVHDSLIAVNSPSLDLQFPVGPDLGTQPFTAQLHFSNLDDNPPVFAQPVGISGVDPEVDWSESDQVLTGHVHGGQTITEQVLQPNPTVEQLEGAVDVSTVDFQQWLTVPQDMPEKVTTLVNQLTAGKTTEYDRAKALFDFFTNPKSGFTYSLSTAHGDSGSDLVDFLTNKLGYCQQFAAALGIMLRIAGIPSRVVLGYTHAAPDASGKFTVTTLNAHAWDEAFFPGLGWVPFDATPNAGAAGGSNSRLPWALQQTQTSAPASSGATSTPTTQRSAKLDTSSAAAPGASSSSGSSGPIPWPTIGVLLAVVALLAIALIPAVVRWVRRRRRLHAGRSGDPDPLWAELSDTARDLGYVWSAARTPRQVVAWLAPQVPSQHTTESLRTLAVAVERSRYAATATATVSLVSELRDVESTLRERRNRSTRLRARLLPASLGWGLRPRGQRS